MAEQPNSLLARVCGFFLALLSLLILSMGVSTTTVSARHGGGPNGSLIVARHGPLGDETFGFALAGARAQVVPDGSRAYNVEITGVSDGTATKPCKLAPMGTTFKGHHEELAARVNALIQAPGDGEISLGWDWMFLGLGAFLLALACHLMFSGVIQVRGRYIDLADL